MEETRICLIRNTLDILMCLLKSRQCPPKNKIKGNALRHDIHSSSRQGKLNCGQNRGVCWFDCARNSPASWWGLISYLDSSSRCMFAESVIKELARLSMCLILQFKEKNTITWFQSQFLEVVIFSVAVATGEAI